MDWQAANVEFLWPQQLSVVSVSTCLKCILNHVNWNLSRGFKTDQHFKALYLLGFFSDALPLPTQLLALLIKAGDCIS